MRVANKEKREAEQVKIVGEALKNAMDYWDVKQAKMANILGVKQPVVSDIVNGRNRFKLHEKRFEIALLFLRCFRSLDALMGGSIHNQKQWIYSPNHALGGVPIDLMESVSGLVRVADYLDDMRGQS